MTSELLTTGIVDVSKQESVMIMKSISDFGDIFFIVSESLQQCNPIFIALQNNAINSSFHYARLQIMPFCVCHEILLVKP